MFRGYLLVIAFGLSLLLHACSSDKPGDNYQKKIQIRPHDSVVHGYLDKVLQVVKGPSTFEYKADNYYSEGTVNVRIRSIGVGDYKDYGVRDGRSGPLYLTLCDSSGKAIRGFSDLPSDPNGDLAIKSLLANKGSVQSIPFYLFMDKGKKLPDEVMTFVVRSKKQEQEYMVDTTDWHHPDWDEIIDQFEQQVEDYAAAVRAARKGDSVALASHPMHIRTVRGTEEVLVRARFDRALTDRQIRRVINIQDDLLDVEKNRIKLSEK